MDPITRKEQYYAAAAGEYNGELPEPITREEKYLYSIALGGGGEGGTTNYNALMNKPSINGVTLTGNKSLDDLGIATFHEPLTQAEYDALDEYTDDFYPIIESEDETVQSSSINVYSSITNPDDTYYIDEPFDTSDIEPSAELTVEDGETI